MKTSETLRLLPATFYLLVGVLFAFVISFLRYLTGPDLSFTLFYLLPVAVVAWYSRLWAALLVGAVSTLFWLGSDILLESVSDTLLYVNAFSRLLLIGGVSYVVYKFVELARIQEDMVVMDPVTGVSSRSGFYALANKEIHRNKRYKRPFSAALLEVGNLKEIAESRDHYTAGFIMQTVAQIIRKNIRSSDLIARIDDTEFIILLSETGDDSRLVVEKIVKKMTRIMKKNRWPVVFHAGVITFPHAPEDVDDIVRAGQELKEEAKQEKGSPVKHASA